MERNRNLGQYVMNYIIVIIGFMSFFDLYCTLQWIGANPYMEVNPLMRCLWVVNPILFVLFKIIATLIFCLIAYRFKDNNLMRRLIWLPLCIYVLITFVHCGG